jgi:altronate dehydratase small subunit
MRFANKTQQGFTMNRRLLVMNEKDNVGVVLETADKGDACLYRDKAIEIIEPVEFAHKIALTDISEKENVVKYGENIGYALTPIRKGQWVHIHNMGCERGK